MTRTKARPLWVFFDSGAYWFRMRLEYVGHLVRKAGI